MEIVVRSAKPCKVDLPTSLVKNVIMTSMFVESQLNNNLQFKIVSGTTAVNEPLVSIW